jgi:hypothetical protein
MLRSSVLFAGLWLGAALHAQVPIAGPVEGFVFDGPTKSLRAVIGSLGSASLGPALVAGIEYGSAAPGAHHAFAFQDGHCLIVTGLGSSEATAVEPAGVPCGLPDGAAWSKDGSVAALYSRSGNWIYTLKGLPGAPRVGDALDVSLLGGSLSAVTLNSQGDRVMMGIVGGTSGVYELVGGQGGVLLLAMDQPASLSFSEDDAILYALDRATNRLSALRMGNLTSEAWPLEGLTDPVAVKGGRDANGGALVYAAGRADRLLVAYDSSGRSALAGVELPVQPTAIEPLGPGSFMLGSRASELDPFWSFAEAPEPKVVFIPATPLAPREEISQ